MQKLLEEFPIYQIFCGRNRNYSGATFQAELSDGEISADYMNERLTCEKDVHGCLVLSVFSTVNEARVYGVGCSDSRGSDEVGYVVKAFDTGAACLLEYRYGCPELTVLDYRRQFEIEFPRTLIADREVLDWRVAEGESLPENERAPHLVRFDDHDQQFRFEIANQFGYGLDLMVEVNRGFATCHIGINGDDAILHVVAQGDGLIVVADGEDNTPRGTSFEHIYPKSYSLFYPKSGWGRQNSQAKVNDREEK